MDRIKEIKELLKKHSYVPLVCQAGDGIYVRMPNPRLMVPRRERIVEAYAIRRGDESGVYHSTDADPVERFISVPEYAIRLYLFGRVLVACRLVPVDHELSCFIDERGEYRDRIEDVVALPSDEEEASREGFLTTLTLEARKDGFSPVYEDVAATHGVLDGYRLIKTFFGESRS
jgi:hypothetical protein